MKTKLQVEVQLDGANRVGSSGTRDRPRPIIVRFRTFTDRQKCMKATSKLKGSNIYINEDVSKATSEIRKAKMDELKEKRRQGYIAYFSGVDIVCKPRPVTSSVEANGRSVADIGEDGATTSHQTGATAKQVKVLTRNRGAATAV
jgi:hypothetical protein